MQAKILKYVPSRIGEPLTAVDISTDLVLFGSISGYIGLCYFREGGGKVIYDEEMLHSVDLTHPVHHSRLLHLG